VAPKALGLGPRLLAFIPPTALGLPVDERKSMPTGTAEQDLRAMVG
jgi:hypothetical protein